MKVLLSIFFLLAFVGESKSSENFDGKTKINSGWIAGKVFCDTVGLESGVCDAQDFNDFNGPDLFGENSEPAIHSALYKVKPDSVALPVFFRISLQYALIDLPPPSLS